MINYGQIWTRFANVRCWAFLVCALGFLFSSAVSEGSPWTANGAKSSQSRPGYSVTVPQMDVGSIGHVSEAIGNISYEVAKEVANMRNKQNIEAALRNNAETLPRPNVGLISSGDLANYPYVDRYLSEQLGDKDITHYYILREDYEFKTLSGESITIPSGFIWDGASIGKVQALALEVGNTRYNSVLAEGLIHDYMYRDPRRFSKDDADELFFVNLVRCENKDPIKIYEGVHVFGDDSYQGHKRRQNQGLYDVFTPEFYKENMRIFQNENKRSVTIDTSKLEALLKEQIAFDLSLLQKGQQKGEKATDAEIANHNSRNDKIFQELVSICKKIDALKLSDEEKIQKLKDTMAPIIGKYAANLKSINQKLVDNKIVRGLQPPSFNTKEVVDVGFLNSDAVKAAKGK